MEVENKKRVDWPMERVIEVFPSKDGVIRSVKIRIAKNGKISEIERPIQRLYMLETSIDYPENLASEKEKAFPAKTENIKRSMEIVCSTGKTINHRRGASHEKR